MASCGKDPRGGREFGTWLRFGACFLAVAALAGCGGSSSSSESEAETSTATTAPAAAADTGTPAEESSASAATGPAGCDLDYVNQQIEQYSGIPAFTPPGPPIDVTELQGKSIYDIPLNSQIQFVDIIDQTMKKVAENDLGMTFSIATNQGDQSQWVQGMNQAVSANVDAIILSQAPDPKVLQPQIVQAKNAGIPTISTHWYDVNDATDTPANVKAPNLAADVPANFTKVVRLEADWAISKSNCDAHMIFIYASDSDGHKQMSNAFADEVTRYCGDSCSVIQIGLPFSQWPTRLQAEIQTQLTANPDVNWVIPDVDYGVQFAVPAINASGRGNGDVKIATFNGTPSVLKQITDGDIVDMDIGENLEWLAYADLDQTMRIMLGADPVEDEMTALRIFSDDNVAETGDPPEFNKGFGDNSFVQGYRTLWGLD